MCRQPCSSEMANATSSTADKWVRSGMQGCSAVGAGINRGNCSLFSLPSPYPEDANGCEQTVYYEMSKED